MRTVFLLGSGISVDAGFPSVRDITDQVVSGKGVWRHTDGRYVVDADHPACALYRARVEPVLRLVDEVRRLHVAHGVAEPTYEELALALRQVSDALSGEYESPAVLPLAALLVRRTGKSQLELRELCDDALNYVDDTVSHLLRNGRLDARAHLAALLDACRAGRPIDLATLNHDLLLEAALASTSISYVDGFERTAADVRLWADNWLEAGVRLLKLHGSIDWYDVREIGDPTASWRPARYVGHDVQHFERPGLELRSSRPTFLTGTFTKILDYQSGIFPEIHWRFHEGLRDADRLVVIGYGFADKAINSRIIGWMSRQRTNRLVICHARPDEAVGNARPAIARAWRGWEESHRLRVLPVFMAELTYEALASCGAV